MMQKQIPEIQAGPSAEVISEQVHDTFASAIKRAPHDVRMHLRTLPPNWKASLGKINQAKDLGIDLGTNQTLVDPYRTGEAAA